MSLTDTLKVQINKENKFKTCIQESDKVAPITLVKPIESVMRVDCNTIMYRT